MIELSYYCLEETKKDELALTIFRSLMESVQSDDFRNLVDEEAKLSLYLYEQFSEPFEKQPAIHRVIQQEGLSVLPLVLVNGKVIKKRKLLKIRELEKLLHIEISFQRD